jgi:hypothetical protein
LINEFLSALRRRRVLGLGLGDVQLSLEGILQI